MSTLTPDQLAQIRARLAQKEDRTHLIRLDETTIIVKTQDPARRQWWRPLLNTLAHLLRQPLLLAVPAPGGSEAQAIEVDRLRALAASGAPVPEVLHVDKNWFAESCVGDRTIDQLIRRDPERQQQYWDDGLAAILALHSLGMTASQCFARNMIWNQGVVSFIDFEENPLTVMQLASAQTRDWLLYLHSTAHVMTSRSPRQNAERLMHYLQQDDASVQQQFLRAASSFCWLRILPKKRKPWGRDIISTQASAAVAYQVLIAMGRQAKP
jgi:hypothetical protein